MRTRKRDYEDAINNHASKDVPQSKKRRKEEEKKSSHELKQPLVDAIAGTLCQQRQMENFSKLPYELLLEITRRLKRVEDYTCFRCISRSMRLSVKEEYFEGLPFRKSLPYLMLPPDRISRDGNNDNIQRLQFYSLVEGESIVASLDFPAFETSSKMYFESLGWFLTIDIDGSMSLLDPFSKTEIPLPHVHTFPRLELVKTDKRFLMRKMVLSSNPNENSDFIMMVIIGDCAHLAFWRLGDKAWNKIHDRRGIFLDVVYGCGEQFYAISSSGVVWVINLAAGQVECRIIIDCRPVLGIILGQGQYILKAINGSVLYIKRTRDKKFYLASEFQVYDIDIETGTWKEIYSLGSMALFLGRNSSIAVDTTDSKGVIKANHIYFTDDFGDYQYAYFNLSNWRGYALKSPYVKGGSVDCGVFNFEMGVVEPIYPVEPLSRNVCPAMWITPNLCF